MLYLVHLVECWHSHTRLELQHKVDTSTVYARVAALRQAIPVVWWRAVCYHYVRRTRQVTRYRNGDAFTSTQVYYERVNSHSASSAFNFSHCGLQDISRHLVNLEQYPATKIRFTRGFSFATIEAETEYEDQRSQFFQEHERRDDYMETREGLDLLNINFKEHMIAFADPEHLPWYVSHIAFWMASVLLLSWPLRVLIDYKTAYVHYHVHKLFGINYLDGYSCPGQMSRVSTMESSELELNIRNNYTMVPSYSEALLMEVCSPGSQQGDDSVPNGTYGAGRQAALIGNRTIITAGDPAGTSYGTMQSPGSSSRGEAIYENCCVHSSQQMLVVTNAEGQSTTIGPSRGHRIFSEENASGMDSRQRRRRRRRKRPQSREQIYVNVEGVLADGEVSEEAPTPSPSCHQLSSCPCPAQPDSPAPSHSPVPSSSPPTEAIELTDSSLQDLHVDLPLEVSPIHTRGQGHVESRPEPPPPYEDALHMRIVPGSASSSPRTTRTQYQLRCIETSL